MPMPTLAGRSFELLRGEISRADAMSVQTLAGNVRAYANDIRSKAALSDEGDRAIDVVLTQVAALAVAFRQFGMLGRQGESAIEQIRSAALEAVGRLGAILETTEGSARSKALGFD